MMDFFRLPIFDVQAAGRDRGGPDHAGQAVKPSRTRRKPTLVARVARGEHGVQVTSFAFSPTGKQIATTNTAGRVTLRAEEGRWQIERFLDFPGYATAVAFSPDGRSARRRGTRARHLLLGPDSPPNGASQVDRLPIRQARHVMFSPDGQSLAVTTDLDGTILLWDLATRRERMVLHHPRR